MSANFFEHPINSPYGPPTRHHALDRRSAYGRSPVNGRRRRHLITPVPKPRKKQRKADQGAFSLTEAQELSTRAQEYDVSDHQRDPSPRRIVAGDPESRRLGRHASDRSAF